MYGLYYVGTRPQQSPLLCTHRPHSTRHSSAGSSPTAARHDHSVLLSWQRTSILGPYAGLVHADLSVIRATFVAKKWLLIRLWTSMMFDEVSENKFSHHLFMHPYSFGLTQPPVQWLTKSLSPGFTLPECAADYTPASSAEVKNAWSPHLTVCRGDWAQG
jgi:hypothetical protein